MDIKFLSTMAVITPDPPASRKLYLDALGLPLGGGEYLHSEQLAGCKSFGIWPLSQGASERRNGQLGGRCRRPVSNSTWQTPHRSTQRHASSSKRATSCCTKPREKPWGQTVARLQSPEGAIIGISCIPMFHDQD